MLDFINLIVILLALACAPYMLARMFRLPAPPSPAILLRASWPMVLMLLRAFGLVLALLWYGFKRSAFYGWKHTPEDQPYLMRLITSSEEGYDPSDDLVVAQVGATATNTGQRIAMQGNEGNEPLPGNNDPEFQGRLKALATLVRAGKSPLAEGIELVFDVKRSGKADSPYGQIRKALDPLLTVDNKAQYPPLTPEQQATRKILDLP